MWGSNPNNSIIYTEPDFPYLQVLAPFQPLSMKAFYCPIDTSLNYQQANKLIKELKPSVLVIPENYTKPHPIAPQLYIEQPKCVKSRLFVHSFIRWSLSCAKSFASELASKIVSREITPGVTISTLTGIPEVEDKVHNIAPCDDESDSKANTSAGTTLHLPKREEVLKKVKYEYKCVKSRLFVHSFIRWSLSCAKSFASELASKIVSREITPGVTISTLTGIPEVEDKVHNIAPCDDESDSKANTSTGTTLHPPKREEVLKKVKYEYVGVDIDLFMKKLAQDEITDIKTERIGGVLTISIPSEDTIIKIDENSTHIVCGGKQSLRLKLRDSLMKCVQQQYAHPQKPPGRVHHMQTQFTLGKKPTPLPEGTPMHPDVMRMTGNRQQRKTNQ
ncbi:integrator complex subunit 9-like [Episyrphus balteatus]|uniref:integrator complex subunit 9-like n=1 Tax=Episyrphus balteatus TaxID=286459 RepID=UPI0024860A6D|nr:integrator complex subunit 9-like [Episyrphus balteatus]